MDKTIFKTTLFNRLSILTQKEIQFLKAYIKSKSMRSAAESAGIALSSVSVVRKKIEGIITGDIQENGRRKGVNRPDKYDDITWETRQLNIKNITDAIVEKDEFIEAIENKQFALNMLIEGTTKLMLGNKINADNTRDQTLAERDKETASNEILQSEPNDINIDSSLDTDESDNKQDSDRPDLDGQEDIHTSPGEEAFLTPNKSRTEFGRSPLADILNQTSTDKTDKDKDKEDKEDKVNNIKYRVHEGDKRTISNDKTNINVVNNDTEIVYASQFNPITAKDEYIITQALNMFKSITVLVLQSHSQDWAFGVVHGLYKGDNRIKIVKCEKTEYNYCEYKSNIIYIKPLDVTSDPKELIGYLELGHRISSGYKEIYIPLPYNVACISSEKVTSICKHGGNISKLLPYSASQEIIRHILGG